jgi:hypothetical protein
MMNDEYSIILFKIAAKLQELIDLGFGISELKFFLSL